MFFLVPSYDINTTLLHFASYFPKIFYSFIQRHPLVFQKKASSTFGSIRPLVFWKIYFSENFCILFILSSEASWVEFFLSTLSGLARIFPESSFRTGIL